MLRWSFFHHQLVSFIALFKIVAHVAYLEVLLCFGSYLAILWAKLASVAAKESYEPAFGHCQLHFGIFPVAQPSLSFCYKLQYRVIFYIYICEFFFIHLCIYIYFARVFLTFFFCRLFFSLVCNFHFESPLVAANLRFKILTFPSVL